MSARPRKPPTQDPIDDSPTTIYDSSEDHRPGKPQPAKTIIDPPKPAPTMLERPRQATSGERTRSPGPTLVDKPTKGKSPTPTSGLPLAAGSAPPAPPVLPRNAMGPIQAVSMKTPGTHKPEPVANPPTPILPRPKLRSASEVTPAKQPQNLGHVAKPYDPKEARARRVREYVIWGCIAVILASAIALVVWFVAR